MKKKSGLVLLTISLLLVLAVPKPVKGNYLVDEGQVLIWKFTPNEGREFYLKVIVEENEWPLDLTAYTYDPYKDNESLHEGFEEIAVNYIYNETVISWLESQYPSETVQRTYAVRDVTCSKIVLDSDNTIYVDQATGVVCDADLDLGDAAYDLILVAWENKDMSEEYYIGEDISISGYPYLLMSLISIVSISIIILLKKKKQIL